ncbi:MAG TPA: RDD family protein [Haliangiales bacterium]|nr:RDD family protein [Haliangiales bacterium]
MDGEVVYVAGFWRRALAALCDAAFVLPIALGAVWLAGRVAGLGLPGARRSGLDTWVDLALAGDAGVWGAAGLALAIGVVYLLVFQATAARTLGMRILGLRIIDIYGGAPSVPRVLLRTLGYLASAATLALGFLWIGFDREKRGLHDWLAGTYVIKAAR